MVTLDVHWLIFTNKHKQVICFLSFLLLFISSNGYRGEKSASFAVKRKHCTFFIKSSFTFCLMFLFSLSSLYWFTWYLKSSLKGNPCSKQCQKDYYFSWCKSCPSNHWQDSTSKATLAFYFPSHQQSRTAFVFFFTLS